MWWCYSGAVVIHTRPSDQGDHSSHRRKSGFDWMMAAAPFGLFANVGTTTVAPLVIGFIVLTAPVAAHIIGRAAHRTRIPRWSGTVTDESPLAGAVNQTSDDDIPTSKPLDRFTE